MFAYLLFLLFTITFVILGQQTLAQVHPVILSKPLIQEFPIPSGSHPHDVSGCSNKYGDSRGTRVFWYAGNYIGKRWAVSIAITLGIIAIIAPFIAYGAKIIKERRKF